MSFRPLLVLDATWAWITYCTTHTCVCVFVCVHLCLCVNCKKLILNVHHKPTVLPGVKQQKFKLISTTNQLAANLKQDTQMASTSSCT